MQITNSFFLVVKIISVRFFESNYRSCLSFIYTVSNINLIFCKKFVTPASSTILQITSFEFSFVMLEIPTTFNIHAVVYWAIPSLFCFSMSTCSCMTLMCAWRSVFSFSRCLFFALTSFKSSLCCSNSSDTKLILSSLALIFWSTISILSLTFLLKALNLSSICSL